MGFFSSIRKIFTGDTSGQAPEQPQDLDQYLEPGREPDQSPDQYSAQEPEESLHLPNHVSQIQAPQGIHTEAAETAKLVKPVAPLAEEKNRTQPPAETTVRPAEVALSLADTTASALPEKKAAKKAAGAKDAPDNGETEAITLALRAAEPKLSVWLNIILAGVDSAGDLLWKRLGFLLNALEAPPKETDTFITSFQSWLANMGYERLEDFRSELQYRLALALDLEDEEDERSRLLLKLSDGLAKTRAQLSRNLNILFAAGRKIDAEFWEELEETLIVADIGVATATELTKRLKKKALELGLHETSDLLALLKTEMASAFKPVRRISAVNKPEVILVIGVNGAGKTTTIAKLSHRTQLQGSKVLLVAGDTFRAAATEQLGVWAKRTGAGFYAKGHGADPAAVAYEAMDMAINEHYDTAFVDTAGRLHTKTNLMEELEKIRRVLGKRHPGAPHRTLLVLDATTGQNALSQVKLFNDVSKIDEIILTKLDGTAKGGIAIAIAMQYEIPISFVGLGEKMEDLRPFDPEAFVAAMFEQEA